MSELSEAVEWLKSFRAAMPTDDGDLYAGAVHAAVILTALEARRTALNYAGGVLAEIGMGQPHSDAEDSWSECPICTGWVNHHGHSRTCRLRLAEAYIAGALSEHTAAKALEEPKP